MGKLEVLGVAASVVALLGLQTVDRPAEHELLTTTRALMDMSRPEFEEWCDKKGAKVTTSNRPGEVTKASCAWLDEASERAWHAALHFGAGSSTPHKADSGLVEPSNDMLLRLVHNTHGPRDGQTADGFPTWDLDFAGEPGRLTVAAFDDITVVRMARTEAPAVLSMR